MIICSTRQIWGALFSAQNIFVIIFKIYFSTPFAFPLSQFNIMKKYVYLFLFLLSSFSTCNSLPLFAQKGNNGHHQGGGNSGNGKGNQPDEETTPGVPPGDPDEPTNVPFDNGVIWLFAVVGVYVLWIIYQDKKEKIPQ